MKLINAKQIKIVHTAISALGLTDEIYRDMLHGHYQVQSCKSLTYAQASDLIDHFKTLGFKVVVRDRRSRRRASGGNIHYLPSREQFALIDKLKAQIKWQLTDGFERWLVKYVRTDRVRTADQARRCIEGLKKMLEHQRG